MIPVAVSVQRAKDLGKDVSKAIPDITAFYKEYSKVNEWLPDAIYLPEEASLPEFKEYYLEIPVLNISRCL